MQSIFSFVYGWIKARDFNSGWCKCVTFEHTVIWIKTFFVLLIKRGFLKVGTINGEIFFITGSCWPPILQYANVHLSNILRFWIKTFFWHIWLKSHSGAICDAFCNITDSFLLILTTVFKRNPSYFIYPFHAFSSFLTKNNDNDAFSLNLLVFNIYLLCIKQN